MYKLQFINIYIEFFTQFKCVLTILKPWLPLHYCAAETPGIILTFGWFCVHVKLCTILPLIAMNVCQLKMYFS